MCRVCRRLSSSCCAGWARIPLLLCARLPSWSRWLSETGLLANAVDDNEEAALVVTVKAVTVAQHLISARAPAILLRLLERDEAISTRQTVGVADAADE